MRTRIALVLAAFAVVFVTARWSVPQPTELVQYDAYVQRKMAAWNDLDSGIMVSELARKGPATLSQLAVRSPVRRRAFARTPARARQEISTPLAKKQWADVDRVVELMDSETTAFTTLQQLAKKKGTKKGGKKEAKKEEKKAEKNEKKDEKKAAGCCGDVADASIHNDGFYLAGNKISGGSNVIIYGTGAHVEHTGGGVANSGGHGPGGGGGGGYGKNSKNARGGKGKKH